MEKIFWMGGVTVTFLWSADGDNSGAFGEVIRTTREAKGVSQDALAQRVGIDRTYLNKIENGRVIRPRQETRQRLLDALGLAPEDVRPAQRDEASNQRDGAARSTGSGARAVRIFFAYSHKDRELLVELREHLSPLLKQRKIVDWHDREISAGQDWEGEIVEQLETADIIVLLVSSSFVASGYAYDREAMRALERHTDGEARVIPVIVRAVDWRSTPLAILQALPEGAMAVDSWPKRDEAWVTVARGIGKVVDDLRERLEAAGLAKSRRNEVSAVGVGESQEVDEDAEPGMLELIEDALGATVDIWGGLRRLDEIGIAFQREAAANRHVGPASGAGNAAAAIRAARATFGRTAASLNGLTASMEAEIPGLRANWSRLEAVDELFRTMLPLDTEDDQSQARHLLAAIPGMQDHFPGVISGLDESRATLAQLRGYSKDLNRSVNRCDRTVQKVVETLVEGERVATHLKGVLEQRLAQVNGNGPAFEAVQ
jgi:transcriptional regulator with XRE-family HTH domain